MLYDYNTCRSPLILREYGRNIQKIMTQITSIEDKTLRTQRAYELVKLMASMTFKSELTQKYWDDLFILSNYTLDVNSPYPMPSRQDVVKKKYNVSYNIEPVKYKYYGRHIELLINKAVSLTSPTEQVQMLVAIVKLMKRFIQLSNHGSNASIEKIVDNIKCMLPLGVNLDESVLKTLYTSTINFKEKMRHKFVNNFSHKRKVQDNNGGI